MPALIGSEILTLFAQIIDQEGNNPLDSTFAYQLMNLAKNKLEEETDWEYLKKKWSIITTVLPTDFSEPVKIVCNQSPIPLRPFEDYEFYEDGYYIDYANLTINALTTYSPTPILTYKKTTDDIAAGTSPAFPARFHPILAYEMAFVYQAGIDGDDLNFRMSAEHKIQYGMLKKLMLSWDADIKARNMNGITDYDYRYIGNGQNINLSDQ
jgi:hypothetical protein